jgi:MFS family permease
MVGIGGILGSLAGGYLTEYEATRWCFAIYAVVGFLISLSGWIMDKSCE